MSQLAPGLVVEDGCALGVGFASLEATRSFLSKLSAALLPPSPAAVGLSLDDDYCTGTLLSAGRLAATEVEAAFTGTDVLVAAATPVTPPVLLPLSKDVSVRAAAGVPAAATPAVPVAPVFTGLAAATGPGLASGTLLLSLPVFISSIFKCYLCFLNLNSYNLNLLF